MVFDSLAHRPLAAALVQLVNADSLSAAVPASVTDSLGRYEFDGVPAGRYLLGFLHPLIDSIGVEPKAREVRVDGTGNVRHDLALPGANTIRVSLCGAAAVADSDAVILGVVRHASGGQAVDSAVVAAEWIEMFLERGRVQFEGKAADLLLRDDLLRSVFLGQGPA